ncbi:MAG: DUF3048 domain-containing protein [Erysipelotrichaceae bacterium]|nr:DUF3048 domain-containing protein [Erysipelotrichaceae bacterium]
MKKGTMIIATVALLVMSCFGLYGCAQNDNAKEEVITADEETENTDTQQEEMIEVFSRNPLTYLRMADEAVGKRPVAIMVENSDSARPQWGMDDENYSPDIILEAEVEGGITRTMWLFADYTALPEIVGPIRSARPPFVRFSELFDAFYIHWGQSESKANYVGADDVIAQDGVDNINQLDFKSSVSLFGRNNERNVALEHTGVIYGEKLPQVIEDYGYRTQIDESKFTSLEFNEEPIRVSDTDCNEIIIDISSRSWTKHWTYSKEDELYHTDDFRNNLTRENILVLFDQTEYITKPGASFSYCNYALAGGEGKFASEGSIMDIEWSVVDGKLVLRDSNNQIIKLNPGKSYIAWISANRGGNVEVN